MSARVSSVPPRMLSCVRPRMPTRRASPGLASTSQRCPRRPDAEPEAPPCDFRPPITGLKSHGEGWREGWLMRAVGTGERQARSEADAGGQALAVVGGVAEEQFA